MHFDVPDPRYTGSTHSRALLALAVRLALGFVALLWLVHLMNWGLELDPRPLGLRPREWLGLVGVITAPLVHGDFAHLVANSVPLALVGATMLYLYPHSTLRVLPTVYLAAACWSGSSAAIRCIWAPAGWSMDWSVTCSSPACCAATGARLQHR